MADSATIMCSICPKQIKQEVKCDLKSGSVSKLEFLSEDAINITENPVACNKCKVEIDKAYELSMQNESVPHLIKQEIEDSITTDNHSLLSNTDVSLDILSCDKCKYNTSDKRNLTNHILTHRFLCNQCNYTSFDESTLINHKEIHVNVRSLKCNICNFICVDFGLLDKHMLIHTDAKLKEQSEISKHLFQCHDCGYTTKNKLKLKSHVRMCINKQIAKPTLRKQLVKVSIIKCDECEYSTSKSRYLSRHMVRMHGELKHKCKLCGFATRNSNYLKLHMLKHSDECKFSCDICDYKTYSKSNLWNHKIVHSEEKPYKCNLCDYSSKRLKNLKSHKVVHSEETPFKCNLCDFTSKFSCSLKLHLSKHSGIKFTCDNCDYKTNSKYNLWNHKIVHSEEKPFRCNLCDYSTKRLKNLKSHFVTHSSERNCN